jgi:hypothetical protein
MRVITAHAIDNLGDLKKRDRPRAASVKQARLGAAEKALKHRIEIADIAARAHFIEIKGGRPSGTKTGLNPVDRSGVVI